MHRSKFSFFVKGLPAPQGSKTAFPVRLKSGKYKAVMVEANAKLPAWRSAVVEACTAQMEADLNTTPFTGPVSLVVTFFMPRPAKPKFEGYPAVKPDVDKLVRAVADALTIAKIWADDCLVVDLAVRKRFAGGDVPPGAYIAVIGKL